MNGRLSDDGYGDSEFFADLFQYLVLGLRGKLGVQEQSVPKVELTVGRPLARFRRVDDIPVGPDDIERTDPLDPDGLDRPPEDVGIGLPFDFQKDAGAFRGLPAAFFRNNLDV